MDQPYISPRYRDETPSAQTALDIFRGTWKSALPLEFKLETGSAEILIWASGVLYHSEDPIDLLSLVTSRTEKLFIWTHYITPEFLKSGHATLFPADGIIKKCYGDVSYTLHKRVYFLEEGPRALPLHWEGGTRLHAYWMERDDILGFLCNVGLTRITIQDEGALDGMPYIGLLAERPNT